jgi:uncharacterized protein
VVYPSTGPLGRIRSGGIRDQPFRRQRRDAQSVTPEDACDSLGDRSPQRPLSRRVSAGGDRTDVRSDSCEAPSTPVESLVLAVPHRPAMEPLAMATVSPELSDRTRRWAMAAVTWYQQLMHGRPSPCRFTPSCSTYALEAFDTFGARRGGALMIRRLVRCRPFGPSGYDPVPPRSNRHDHHHTTTARTAEHV